MQREGGEDERIERAEVPDTIVDIGPFLRGSVGHIGELRGMQVIKLH